MFTVMVFAGAAFVLDQAARELAADAKLAMKRADISQDFVSRITGVPMSRLSDQLNGKTPFTALYRFTAREIREETDFWTEFLELRAQRIDRLFVSRDLGRLIAGVEALVGRSPMATTDTPRQSQSHRIELPLGQKEAS